MQRTDVFRVAMHAETTVSWWETVRVMPQDVAAHACLPLDGITQRLDYEDLAAAAAEHQALMLASYRGVPEHAETDFDVPDTMDIEVGPADGPLSDHLASLCDDAA